MLYRASRQQERLYKLFFTTAPTRSADAVDNFRRSPLLGSDVLSIAAVFSSRQCSRDKTLCSDIVSLRILHYIYIQTDVLSIAAVAGCALEMKYFAASFLNFARHCISTNLRINESASSKDWQTIYSSRLCSREETLCNDLSQFRKTLYLYEY